MVTGPGGRRRAVTRAASASVGNGNASFSGPHVAVGNLRISQTECPPGYATRIANIAKSPCSRRLRALFHGGGFRGGGPGFRRSGFPRIDPGVDESCRARVHASPLARPLWLGGVSGMAAGPPSLVQLKRREGNGLAPG